MGEIEKLKVLLHRALFRVEEMASLTENPDDAELAEQIKEVLSDEKD